MVLITFTDLKIYEKLCTFPSISVKIMYFVIKLKLSLKSKSFYTNDDSQKICTCMLYALSRGGNESSHS